MMTTLRENLMQKLVESSLLYPEMRFGQLLAFVSSLAGKDASALMQEVNDEAICEAAEQHLSKRARQLDVDVKGDWSLLSLVRTKLLRALEQLSGKFPNWSLGQLVFNLSALAHVNVYDIEDEQLLAVSESSNPGVQWFNWYVENLEHESVVHPAEAQPAYRCPCCNSLTFCGRGHFEICPVCYWEDDGQDETDAATVRGGPNGHLNLVQARENYRRFSVCDLKYKDHVRPPRPKEM